MWEMFDDDVNCDECGGFEPPPKFTIPPPPKPPFLQELNYCKEDIPMNWDNDKCDVIPVFDINHHVNSSFQTPIVAAISFLVFMLVLLIVSILFWKHKRKVQHFVPCKTPTRTSHLSGIPPTDSNRDSDTHLGHQPLVMHPHLNVDIIQSRPIHYPSGFPMTRSPPIFVCSSPGPDPYRSNENVYEELTPVHDSDIESDILRRNSDDNFAEDELSIPEEKLSNSRTFSSDGNNILHQQQQISTIYSEQSLDNPHHQHQQTNVTNNSNCISNGSNGCSSTGNLGFRLGSTTIVQQNDYNHQKLTATATTTTTTATTTASASNNESNSKSVNVNYISCNINDTNNHQNYLHHNNTSSELNGSDIVPIVLDDRNPLAFKYNNDPNCSSNIIKYDNNKINNINCNSNNYYDIKQRTATTTTLPHFKRIPKTENDIEKRNFNSHHYQPSYSSVATIYREQISCNTLQKNFPQPYYTTMATTITPPPLPLPSSGIQKHSQQQQQQHLRSRTNLHQNQKCFNNKRRIVPPIDYEPTYGYTEPIYHEEFMYDSFLSHPKNTTTTNSFHSLRSGSYHQPYISQEYPQFRTLSNSTPHQLYHHHHHYHRHQQQQQQQQQQQHHQHPHRPEQQHPDYLLFQQHPQQQHQIYSRDSSFGSDSGYSHDTQTSGCGGVGGGGSGINGISRGDSGRVDSGGSNSGGSTTNEGCGRTDNIKTTTATTISASNNRNTTITNCNSNSSSINPTFLSGKIGINFVWNRKICKNNNSANDYATVISDNQNSSTIGNSSSGSSYNSINNNNNNTNSTNSNSNTRLNNSNKFMNSIKNQIYENS